VRGAVELVILRHGPAADRSPRKWPNDDDRPLTPDGIRETRRAARGLAALAGEVDRFYSSPAERARRTAEIAHEEWDDPPKLELLEALEPGAPAQPVLAHLNRTAKADGRYLVVGHEPTLGELIGLATTGEAVSLVRLSKSGAASLSFPRQVVPSGATLEWLLTRKQLMRLAGSR
jgi:phosphohistidine phosphatase